MNKKLVYLILLPALILSACAGGKPSSEIKVEMTDFAFTPNRYSVPAGEQITLNAIHEGLVEHDFVIMKLNTDVGGHFDENDLVNVYWQIKIQSGQSQMVTFKAPSEPGAYQIVCGMAGHVEAGMVGTLEVISP
jgi:plastocyanin